MPGNLRQSHRRLWLGAFRRRRHHLETAQGRQSALCAAHPAGRRRARDALVSSERIFKEHGVDVVGAEFTNGDNARQQEDYINKYGKIDAIWMDAGATAVAALNFEDSASLSITGEDQEDFLEMEGEGAHRDGADLSDLPVALAGDRGGRDPQGRAGHRSDAELPQPTIARPISTSTSTTDPPPAGKDLPGYRSAGAGNT